jgi:hypothetical protein
LRKILATNIVTPIEKHSEAGEGFGFYYQPSWIILFCSGDKKAGAEDLRVFSTPWVSIGKDYLVKTVI